MLRFLLRYDTIPQRSMFCFHTMFSLFGVLCCGGIYSLLIHYSYKTHPSNVQFMFIH
jgi:hypothetical protein